MKLLIKTRESVFKPSLVAIVCISIMVSSITFAKDDDKNKSDKIVGAWNCTAVLGTGDLDYLVETYHDDGTVLASTTGQNSQSVSIVPTGTYGSAAHGVWKKVGNNRYLAIASEVFNTKSDAIPGVPAFIAGLPSLRSINTITTQINPNGSRTLVSGKVDFYQIGDLDFHGPVLLSFPINSVTCQKLGL